MTVPRNAGAALDLSSLNRLSCGQVNISNFGHIAFSALGRWNNGCQADSSKSAMQQHDGCGKKWFHGWICSVEQRFSFGIMPLNLLESRRKVRAGFSRPARANILLLDLAGINNSLSQRFALGIGIIGRRAMW
jgi:hypothetical protein